MKYVLIIVICLVAGFLIGYIPMAVKKAELNSELNACGDNLKNVYERLEIAENYQVSLNLFIGAYEATAKRNYGIAKNRAIAGFEKSKSLAEKGISPFAEIAPRRDEIVALLAKGGDNAEPEMRLLLFSLYKGE